MVTGIVDAAGLVPTVGAAIAVVVPVNDKLVPVKYQFPPDPWGVKMNLIVVPAAIFCKADMPLNEELPAVPTEPVVVVVFQEPISV